MSAAAIANTIKNIQNNANLQDLTDKMISTPIFDHHGFKNPVNASFVGWLRTLEKSINTPIDCALNQDHYKSKIIVSFTFVELSVGQDSFVSSEVAGDLVNYTFHITDKEIVEAAANPSVKVCVKSVLTIQSMIKKIILCQNALDSLNSWLESVDGNDEAAFDLPEGLANTDFKTKVHEIGIEMVKHTPVSFIFIDGDTSNRVIRDVYCEKTEFRIFISN